MKKNVILYLVFLLLVANSIFAQVSTNFNISTPISVNGKFGKVYEQKIDLELTARNIEVLVEAERLEKSQSLNTKRLKIATPVPIDISLDKLINWTSDNEFAYGKYTIKLTSAFSASINFDKFYLPKGTEMFIYNENGEMITGPITENENNQKRKWGSWVYKGEFITIEIKTPIVSLNELELHSNNVAYGYKEIYKSIKAGGFGRSGPCNINVVCPTGVGWESERNSVSLILDAGGGYVFSGALIMNTCGTNQPYVLTANHVYDGNTEGWRFAFQEWSPTCPNPGTNVTNVMYNGSTLRARNAASDFCLVELITTPPANSGLHYSGWSRIATPATQATGIHHPSGDVMKISRANSGVTVGSYGGTVNQHWQANWSLQFNGAGQFVTPVTEPGSSGSPLFDQNRRIIGQLSGGPSACGGAELWDFYGAFDLSWTGGGTNATRLSNWLDPNNSGAITTNTTNISNLTNVSNPTFSIVGTPTDNYICSGSSTYTLSGLSPSANATILWSVSNSSVASIPNPSNGTSVIVTKTGNGIIKLTATITICGQQPISVDKSIMVGASVGGYYTIISNYNNPAIPINLTNSNSPLWLPKNQGFGINAYITSPAFYSVTWSRATNSYNFNYNTNGSTLSFLGTSSGVSYEQRNGIFNLTASTACGTYIGTFTWPIIAQGWSFSLKASPNPATSSLNVTIENEPDKLKNLNREEIITIRLYNFNTNILLKEWKFGNDRASYLLTLPEHKQGQYILVVKKGPEQQSKIIVLE